jgi:integrase
MHGYSGSGFGRVFRTLARKAGVLKANGQPPRVHDVRHSFAVGALLRWYRAGLNVHAKLPLLSTYMGHVSIASTQYYLHFVEPVASAASARFAQHYGHLLTPHAQEETP